MGSSRGTNEEPLKGSKFSKKCSFLKAFHLEPHLTTKTSVESSTYKSSNKVLEFPSQWILRAEVVVFFCVAVWFWKELQKVSFRGPMLEIYSSKGFHNDSSMMNLKWKPSVGEFYVEPTSATKHKLTTPQPLSYCSAWKFGSLDRTFKELFRMLDKTRLTHTTPTNTLRMKGSSRVLWLISKSCFLTGLYVELFLKLKASGEGFYIIHSRVALNRKTKQPFYGGVLDRTSCELFPHSN